MKEKIFSALLFACLLPLSVLAQSWQDPETKVWYFCNENSGEAEVRKSSGATGDITILSQITYRGRTYDVTTIVYRAFEGCSGLTSVVLPSSIKSIGEYAFFHCSGLTSIALPSGLTTIDECTFAGCSELASVNIPSSVTTICTAAFLGCSSLTSITIPSGVSSIGKSTFYGCSSLSTVDIPEGVETIDMSTFQDCSSLSSITIPSSVISIGEQAFWGCSGLNTLEIPEGVKEIGRMAFGYCSSLSAIAIPSSVTTIANYAFYGCSNLKMVTSHILEPFEIGESVFETLNGEQNAFITATLYVPEGTKSSYLATPAWNKFQKIVEQGSEPQYQDGDTFTATTTEGVELRYTVISAADKTCRLGAAPLEEFGAPTAFTELTYGTAPVEGTLTIPAEVQGLAVVEIGRQALQGGRRLTQINIPTTVKSIGDNAFASTGITSLFIPASVESIGEGIFLSTSALQTVTVDESNPVYDSRDCNGIIETATNTLVAGCKTTTISSTIEGIAAYTFYFVQDLEAISIPESVTNIDSRAFFECHNLKAIMVAEGNPVYDSRNNCNAIIHTASNELVVGCSATIIPEDVTSIGKAAFSLRYEMTELNIPESVTSIGDEAFYKCSGLTTLHLPANLEHIGTAAFQQLSKITELALPEGLKTIGSQAFFLCQGLEKLVIPSSVEQIGTNAFSSLFRTKEVYCYITEPFAVENTFLRIGNQVDGATLYVPKGTKEQYEASSGWEVFSKIIEMDDATTSVSGISSAAASMEYYSIGGQRTVGQRRGPNVVRMNDGTVKKVLVK